MLTIKTENDFIDNIFIVMLTQQIPDYYSCDSFVLCKHPIFAWYTSMVIATNKSKIFFAIIGTHWSSF